MYRRLATHFLILLATLLLAACASAPPPRPAAGSTAAVAANAVLFRSISLVGTPYQWGGNTPRSGFDCSGLVDYVFRSVAGIKLPRTTAEMSRMQGTHLSRHELAPGDLVFFDTLGAYVSHVAIYVGKSRFVHAPNSGGKVRLDTLNNPYWRKHFAYGLRVLR